MIPRLAQLNSDATMTVRLDPLISEFETEEQALGYDAWFRSKVLEAMTSAKPRVAHDEAMARVDTIVAEKRASRAGRPLD